MRLPGGAAIHAAAAPALNNRTASRLVILCMTGLLLLAAPK
jgi:hypothetical protein